MTDPRIEQKAREVAEGWLGPEMFAPAMASGASWQPTEMKTFTIKPHEEVVQDLAGRIAVALQSAVAEEREECAKIAEALALKLCWHCAEHVKNGYKFMLYGHTEVDLDSGDARQIYAAAGTGENWGHLIRTESGCEWTEKCKAWMLWSVVYCLPARGQKETA